MKYTTWLIPILISFGLEAAKSREIVNIYMVKYPPYNISNTEGVGPKILHMMNDHLKEYKIKIIFLPARRLVQSYSQGKLPYIFHTVSHISESVKKETMILPMVKLVEKYAYLKDESLKKASPTLGYFQGDSEERNFVGSDKYNRVELATPKSMVSMLTSGRVDFINCLVPMCRYFAKDQDFKFIDKEKGLQSSLGGLIIYTSKSDKKLNQALENAYKKVASQKSFKQFFIKYLAQFNINYDDVFPKKAPSYEFVGLDKPYVYSY